MTRHMDTYWCVMGASPLIYPWWLWVSEKLPEDESTDNARKWTGWQVRLQEIDPDEGVEVPGEHLIDHDKIIGALRYVLEHHEQFSTELWSNAMDLYHGNIEDVDFDSDTADQILQLICFGEVKYG